MPDDRDPRATLIDLAAHDIDPRHGFVAPDDPPDRLPGAFAPWEDMARDLNAALLSGHARARMAALPVIDPAPLSGRGEEERAMLLLSVLANAFVHGGAEPATRLPAGVAVPLSEMARRLDRVPIVTHASMVLNNWRRLDRSAPLSADNADCQLLFLGGADERWFFLATLGLELEGVPALPVLARLPADVAAGRTEQVAEALVVLERHLRALRTALSRMGEWCAPATFYSRIRPWLAGWPAPGVIYEGVDEAPQMWLGGSAAQSTLIQAFDAALGVRHDSAETGHFLREMRRYMPAPHRAFLSALEAGPDLRAFVAARAGDAPALARAHDAALSALADLRRDHMAMAARYISAQSEGDSGLGTGGTAFIPFLRTARDETLSRRLGKGAETGA
ncbi:MAG: hypothetical protein JJU40_15235 [Rhodobacteraceae bacterium]|nr:hypothetical protein [Paracoccaceae bacterium]